MDFSPKRVTEVEIFTVDYGPLLAAGETIVTAVWSNSVRAGVDEDPAAMLQGAAAINGSRVSQYLQGGLAGVTYAPICTVTTSEGQTLVLPESSNGALPVIN